MNPGLYALAGMTVSDNGFVTAISSTTNIATNTVQNQQAATLIYLYGQFNDGVEGLPWGGA